MLPAACECSFQQLKTILCTSPVLQAPDFDKPFVLQTDASNCGVGAVLSQYDDSGVEHPVAYYSRKFLPHEERYSSVQRSVWTSNLESMLSVFISWDDPLQFRLTIGPWSGLTASKKIMPD